MRARYLFGSVATSFETQTVREVTKSNHFAHAHYNVHSTYHYRRKARVDCRLLFQNTGIDRQIRPACNGTASQ
jgi:hypothetical protein